MKNSRNRDERVPLNTHTRADKALRWHTESLTGVRWFLGVWVMLFHLRRLESDPYSILPAPAHAFLNNGRSAVDLLLVLSGFVITLAYLKRFGPGFSRQGFGQLVSSRISRLWPVFIVVSLGTALMMKLLAGFFPGVAGNEVGAPLTLLSFLGHFFMVQTWFDPTGIHTSWVLTGWSVSALFLASLTFPLFARILWKMREWPAWALILLSLATCAPFALQAWNQSDVYSYSWLVRILSGFYAGSFAYLAVARMDHQRQRSRWFSLGLMGLGVIWVAGLVHFSPQGERASAFLPFMPILLIALTLDSGPVHKVLSTNLMTVAGQSSYALYLVHYPVMVVVAGVADRTGILNATALQGLGLVAVAVVLSHLAAYALWQLVEVPAGRWLKESLEQERHVSLRGLLLHHHGAHCGAHVRW